MKPIFKNIIAVIAGVIVGSTVNMGIVTISEYIIAPPEGIDVTTMEGVVAAMPLFEPKHFLFPFLAHAIGTLVGALITALIAATHKLNLALIIGAFFLIGGISMVVMIPTTPLWFIVLDLAGAYIPMAYIGAKLITRNK